MKETEQEKETYSWVMRIEGFIEIAQQYEKQPGCYSLKKSIHKAVSEAIDHYNNQYRLYDYTDNISEQEDDIEFKDEE